MTKEELDFLKATGFEFRDDHWRNHHNGNLEYSIICVAPEGFKMTFWEQYAESIEINDFNNMLRNTRASNWFKINESLVRKSLEDKAKMFFDLTGKLPNLEDLLK